MPRIEIREWNPSNARVSDIGIFSCSCEARSTLIFSTISPKPTRLMVFASAGSHAYSYNKNCTKFNEAGAFVDDVDDAQIEHVIQCAMQQVSGNRISITLDVTSFSRPRLAMILALLLSEAEHRDVDVVIGYTLAMFNAPPDWLPVNHEVAPVHPRFSGLGIDPALQLVSVVGLGYEQNKALGAVEYLQSNNTWLFIPTSPEVAYLAAVRSSNALLLDVTSEERQILYPVLDPVFTFSILESALAGLTRNKKVALLPFGPKIFFALSLLVASTRDDVSVWHVSGEDAEEPIDRKASGHHTLCSLSISSSRVTGN